MLKRFIAFLLALFPSSDMLLESFYLNLFFSFNIFFSSFVAIANDLGVGRGLYVAFEPKISNEAV